MPRSANLKQLVENIKGTTMQIDITVSIIKISEKYQTKLGFEAVYGNI